MARRNFFPRILYIRFQKRVIHRSAWNRERYMYTLARARISISFDCLHAAFSINFSAQPALKSVIAISRIESRHFVRRETTLGVYVFSVLGMIVFTFTLAYVRNIIGVYITAGLLGWDTFCRWKHEKPIHKSCTLCRFGIIAILERKVD